MAKAPYYITTQFPKTLIIGIHAPYNRAIDIDTYYGEFINLVKTSGTPYEDALFIKLRTIDPAYFVTTGKLKEVKEACEKYEIKQVIISEPLTARQARNLEDYLDCTIMDRTELILDIFNQAAHSSEGKIQVAIALLQHQKSRLAGKGIFLSQQAGFVGLHGGPGETAKERARRHIERSIFQLKRKLTRIEKTREMQRKQRLMEPQICLIGYTNTGKSTILNVLTRSDVLAEDKLFATLDTTTRSLYIDGQKKGIISDTVGFIQNLPPQLIEAFKSTLSELEFADLLIHVVDISDSNWESHIQVVLDILDELEIDKPMLYAFNKADKVENIEELEHRLEKYIPYVVMSAQSKEGLQPLLDFLKTWEKK